MGPVWIFVGLVSYLYIRLSPGDGLLYGLFACGQAATRGVGIGCGCVSSPTMANMGEGKKLYVYRLVGYDMAGMYTLCNP